MISVRRLPHLYPQDRWLFLTWSLHGAVRPCHFPPPHKASAGQAFVWLDRQLDMARAGPMFLRQGAIANLVVESLHRGAELGHYELASFVVMANHVHVLLLPKAPPSRLMKSLKGSTAREANRLLGRTGEPFWQRESREQSSESGIGLARLPRHISATGSSNRRRRAEVNQFVPSQSISQCALHLSVPRWRQRACAGIEPLPRRGANVVQVCDTSRRQPLSTTQPHLHGNRADGGGDLCDDELAEILVRVVATQQQNRPSAGWCGQIRPPDFELSHGLNSSGVDQSSAFCAESGRLR